MTTPELLQLGFDALTLALAYLAWKQKGEIEQLWDALEQMDDDISEQAEQEQEQMQRFYPIELNHNTAILDMQDGNVTLLDTGSQRRIGFRENT